MTKGIFSVYFTHTKVVDYLELVADKAGTIDQKEAGILVLAVVNIHVHTYPSPVTSNRSGWLHIRVYVKWRYLYCSSHEIHEFLSQIPEFT